MLKVVKAVFTFLGSAVILFGIWALVSEFRHWIWWLGIIAVGVWLIKESNAA